MAILNYSTEVPAERTVGEITALLVRKGARSIQTDFDEHGKIESVTFVMVVGGLPTRFRLPSKSDGVARVMLADKPWNKARHRQAKNDYEAKVCRQAEWVSWRILKDWVEAQIALIESGQAEAAQVFLPYAMEHSGRTMYELFVENNQRSLTSGGSEGASSPA